MKRIKNPKLKLNKKTVRDLKTNALSDVQGGNNRPKYSHICAG